MAMASAVDDGVVDFYVLGGAVDAEAVGVASGFEAESLSSLTSMSAWETSMSWEESMSMPSVEGPWPSSLLRMMRPSRVTSWE